MSFKKRSLSEEMTIVEVQAPKRGEEMFYKNVTLK
jgi:hypothetical protein